MVVRQYLAQISISSPANEVDVATHRMQANILFNIVCLQD